MLYLESLGSKSSDVDKRYRWRGEWADGWGKNEQASHPRTWNFLNIYQDSFKPSRLWSRSIGWQWMEPTMGSEITVAGWVVDVWMFPTTFQSSIPLWTWRSFVPVHGFCDWMLFLYSVGMALGSFTGSNFTEISSSKYDLEFYKNNKVKWELIFCYENTCIKFTIFNL